MDADAVAMDADAVAAKYDVSGRGCIGWSNGGGKPGSITPRQQTKFRHRVLAGQEGLRPAKRHENRRRQNNAE